MGNLEKRKQQILQMLYNEELPIRVIGKHLSISESRVSQIHQRVLGRLRGLIEVSAAA